ncbi:hypothetical protein [Streptomyces sp. MB09-02B]|uniref:hypothetical protein n=1 Tax=Streptomyces sp. MB09-02B TaxID=3028667 RepID=UPI0029B37453|nr:hypothetical protein [Streptomyces sp. MB09-02B]MDX3645223.1 hypothetical protein [Streptomyces sp. MB09-02B]
MGRLSDFARSLRPGNDQQLANDLSTQRRASHRRNLRANAAAGQAWEDADRQQDKRGGWYRAR